MTKNWLAGPILRRVTTKRICVWFATTQLIDLRLEIFSKTHEVLGTSTKNEYCQVGENLFVYLLQARPNDSEQPYPDNVFLYYQLVDINNTPVDLSDLSYDKSTPHPKFFIPTDVRQLLHGSCRKPHGGGSSSDALSYGDNLLMSTHNDLIKRPALLLLTGDQIYADDVSISVLALLKEKATELIGRNEMLPLNNQTQGQILYQNAQQIPLHGRLDFLKNNHSGFTSSESQNHLLSFGEFACMYIYAFGNAQQWRVTNDWEKLAVQLPVEIQTDTKKLATIQQLFTSQQVSVHKFEETLPNVRRLLANVPTYMIFDDHDVTDDWNITNDWYNDVRHSSLGQRVVANALSSYWAFQAWGNDSDNFDKDLQLTISQHLLDTTQNPEISERYDLHTWKHRGWGFSVPTNPPIIAIDSRTQRMPTMDSYLPVLLDRYARDWLRVEWAKLKTGQTITADTCPIFVATTPVLGFSVLERVQKFLYWAAEILESYKYIQYLERFIDKEGYLTKKMINFADIEAWTSNKESFLTLMNCLSQDMRIKQCVFLSGDVHYAFSALGKYAHENSENKLHCYQLVSTSLKNSPDEKQLKDIEAASRFGAGSTKHANKLKELLPWLPVDSWENWIHLLASQGSKTRVHADCNLGLVKFENGLPIRHILLVNHEIIYDLPNCTEFNFTQ